MGRKRQFDHDEARQLFAAGSSVRDLVDKYGVSYQAIAHVVKGPEYVVLRQELGEEPWLVEPLRSKAASGRSSVPAAIREAVALRADADADADGMYVAVPARSWKPVKVTTKTETTVVRGEANRDG